jgi:hypothetical protein
VIVTPGTPDRDPEERLAGGPHDLVERVRADDGGRRGVQVPDVVVLRGRFGWR